MSAKSHTLRIGVGFLAVYFIWGTTYLAIRFGLEGFPPFMLNGIRFVIAGLVLLLIARVRNHPWPTKAQWWNSGRIGLLMMVGGIGLVSVAEDLGVGSGVAATAVAVIPMWVALITGLLGDWPNRREWLGLALGLVGVLVLVGEGDFRSTLAGTILIVIAPMFWSIGSVWSARADLPESSAMLPSAQLLSAGVALVVIGPIRGERIMEIPPSHQLACPGLPGHFRVDDRLHRLHLSPKECTAGGGRELRLRQSSCGCYRRGRSRR